MTHNLYPFKPIPSDLSSGTTGVNICLSKRNLQRYNAEDAVTSVAYNPAREGLLYCASGGALHVESS
jgi:hypothetical protein